MSKLTEKALMDAAMELLAERPLDKVTIQDITDRCGVTRNTFYYHFQDIYDLLSRVILRQADELIEIYQDVGDWQTSFLTVLNYFYEHKKMINHVYKSISREELDRYLNGIIGSYALELIEMQLGDEKVSENAKILTADFFKNAFVGEISQWIDEDMSMTPDTFAAICSGMFDGTVKAALRSAEKTLAEIKSKQSK